jgi:serine/threonine protein kinase
MDIIYRDLKPENILLDKCAPIRAHRVGASAVHRTQLHTRPVAPKPAGRSRVRRARAQSMPDQGEYRPVSLGRHSPVKASAGWVVGAGRRACL